MTDPQQTIDDGGPAFPTDSEHQPQSHVFHHEGMSTRMWHAGMAMQGILPSIPNYQNEHDMIGKVTKISFSYADAMIAAAQKEQSA